MGRFKYFHAFRSPTHIDDQGLTEHSIWRESNKTRPSRVPESTVCTKSIRLFRPEYAFRPRNNSVARVLR
jgi:hypothetical protein